MRLTLGGITVLLLFVIFGSASAKAAEWTAAGCGDMLESHTRTEALASNALDAEDYINAYIGYQQAVEYRANCADVTSGYARAANRMFEAFDYCSFAIAARGTTGFKGRFSSLMRRCSEVAGSLVNDYSIDANTRRKMRTLRDYASKYE